MNKIYVITVIYDSMEKDTELQSEVVIGIEEALAEYDRIKKAWLSKVVEEYKFDNPDFDINEFEKKFNIESIDNVNYRYDNYSYGDTGEKIFEMKEFDLNNLEKIEVNSYYEIWNDRKIGECYKYEYNKNIIR